MSALTEQITKVLREHERLDDECRCGKFVWIDGDEWAAHVASVLEARLNLAALEELLRYFTDSPQGWVGEGHEAAEDALAVLRGAPVSEHWQQAIAKAKAAGWPWEDRR